MALDYFDNIEFEIDDKVKLIEMSDNIFNGIILPVCIGDIGIIIDELHTI